jgi:mRNA interferase MazF
MEVVRRGDLVTAVLPGDYGKPRPVLVVQDDAFSELAAATVLPLTSDLRNFPLFRITVEPSGRNGLDRRSQVMVDKVVTVPRAKVGRAIGSLEQTAMDEVDFALARFLGFG